MGPNHRSILKSDANQDICSYAPHLQKNVIVQSKIPYDALVGEKKPDLNSLRVSVSHFAHTHLSSMTFQFTLSENRFIIGLFNCSFQILRYYSKMFKHP